MNYFFDTTALVKLYHLEAGSDSVLEIYHGNDTIIIAEVSKIEFLSIVNKKFKEKEIDQETSHAVISRFEMDLENRFKLFKFSSLVIAEAWSLMRKHTKRFSLRTLESLQLAFFKSYCEDDDVFVCAERRLVKVVELEGLTTMVPV